MIEVTLKTEASTSVFYFGVLGVFFVVFLSVSDGVFFQFFFWLVGLGFFLLTLWLAE